MIIEQVILSTWKITFSKINSGKRLVYESIILSPVEFGFPYAFMIHLP